MAMYMISNGLKEVKVYNIQEGVDSSVVVVRMEIELKTPLRLSSQSRRRRSEMGNVNLCRNGEVYGSKE